MHFFYKYELPAIVNESSDRRIFLFGDSFAQLVRKPDHARQGSWVIDLALLLDAQIHSYGISGAAESTILYCYQQTYNKDRDFTIIFHTHPTRSDNYYDLRDLTLHDYERWDKILEKQPCLHVYWSNEKHYKFKSGSTIPCHYWLNLHKKDNIGEIAPDDLIGVEGVIHHMYSEDNKKFAVDVYNKIKGEF